MLGRSVTSLTAVVCVFRFSSISWAEWFTTRNTTRWDSTVWPWLWRPISFSARIKHSLPYKKSNTLKELLILCECWSSTRLFSGRFEFAFAFVFFLIHLPFAVVCTIYLCHDVIISCKLPRPRLSRLPLDHCHLTSRQLVSFLLFFWFLFFFLWVAYLPFLGERRLDHDTNIMALRKVNPYAEWIVKPRD